MSRTLDVATSLFASVSRLGAGLSGREAGPRPERPLELYEYEACPFCRKVREALTCFDLDAMIYPCPRGGPRYREEVKRRGGKAQFPYLVDPNTGEEMYESSAIVRYLAERYGRGKVPASLALGPITTASSAAASLWRPGRGARYRPAKAPERPLELYSFEASPFCRIVREVLCELEIPYLLHNVGKGSEKRPAFKELSGKMMVPYLVDPNTGRAMFESADIAAYLRETYAAQDPV
ncbi:MAG: glutathione S-transferase N-terminal domain-containing protein [Polyangiaceae bacterium]|nr:glutathione S-transferase N-terminal domain-containing protein [Polyangiaceae bacterium]